jgi:hypothetical protein
MDRRRWLWRLHKIRFHAAFVSASITDFGFSTFRVYESRVSVVLVWNMPLIVSFLWALPWVGMEAKDLR